MRAGESLATSAWGRHCAVSCATIAIRFVLAVSTWVLRVDEGDRGTVDRALFPFSSLPTIAPGVRGGEPLNRRLEAATFTFSRGRKFVRSL